MADSNPPVKTITVYTKTACPQCTATKRWLKDYGHSFDEVDATEPQTTAALRALGYLQAPVTVVAYTDGTPEQHWSGFNPTALEQHIGKEAT